MIRHWLRNNWQLLIVILVGIAAFFVYAWFPRVTSGESFNVYLGEVLAPVDMEQIMGDKSQAQAARFNSPDETLNYFWTRELAKADVAWGPSLQDKRADFLQYSEPLEGIGNNLIRPRSVNVVDNRVLPGSFYGMFFIYGTLASIFGAGIITFLTPFFAVLGVLFFFLLIALIFNKNIALISALLAYVLPGWIYFAARSMYHNVLFVVLLIIGLYFLLKALGYKQTNDTATDAASQHTINGSLVVSRMWSVGAMRALNYLSYALAGFFVGLSLITRTSELGWVALVVLLVFLFNFRKINWAGLALFAATLVTAFIPVFTTNLQLYNAPLSLAYRPDLTGELVQFARQPALLYELLVSPFGFHPRVIAVNAFNYLGTFFWYISVPALVGLIVWLIFPSFTRRGKGRSQSAVTNDPPRSPLIKGGGERKKQWAFLAIWLVASAYLLTYYGSWLISDRIDNQSISIGTSYVRYWIPIYLGALPFLGFLLYSFVRLTRYVWARVLIVSLALVLIGLPSARVVFTDTDESLARVRDNIRTSQAKALRLQKLVPAEAVVVLGFKQADKIFFPEHRRIIPELAVPQDFKSVARLSQEAELYYYHFADPETAATISRREFEPFGLQITGGERVFEREWLYRLVQVE